MMDKKWIRISAFLIGLINGLFGGGAGMIAAACLLKMGKRQHEAQATAMAIIFPMAICSALIYTLRIGLTTPMILTAIGALPGGIFGAWLMKKAKSVWLSRIFALFALAAGIRMLMS